MIWIRVFWGAVVFVSTLLIGSVGIVLLHRPERATPPAKDPNRWRWAALVGGSLLAGLVLGMTGTFPSESETTAPPTSTTTSSIPASSSSPTTTPNDPSTPAGPRTGCPISSQEAEAFPATLTVLRWCLHESKYLKDGRRELKLKPRIHNTSDRKIDISLASWRLLVTADVDISTWKPIRNVRVAKPTKIDCYGVAAWAIPPNGDGLTYKAAFATHWNAKKLAADKKYSDDDYYQGDIVWWTPNLTDFVEHGGILRAPQVLGIALINDGKIIGFSPTSEWSDEAWANPNDF